jgi:hypothetical protein
MSSQQETYLTIALSPFAIITGYLGLSLTQVDLILAILFKLLSIVSVSMIIIVNWEKTINQLKQWLKFKK